MIEDIQLSKNFKLSEFVCKEGKGEVLYDTEMIDKLQALRDCFNVPVQIVSGYRSPEYNRGVGGSINSQHLLGKAADIAIDLDKERVKEKAIELGFKGIGLYDTFIHLDVRDDPNPRGYSFWDERTQ